MQNGRFNIHNNMQDNTNVIQLGTYETGDILDIITKLEKSFGLQLPADALATVNTFGEFCSVFGQHNTATHQDDCTHQQAFYKIRKALAGALQINEQEIGPGTQLKQLFTRPDRYHKTRLFRAQLGLKIHMFYYPGWLATIVLALFLSALFAFFINWHITVAALLASGFAHVQRERLSLRLRFETVGALTRALTEEHYHGVRRTSHTVNRKEVPEIITRVFSQDLAIPVSQLTPDARFIWDG